MLINNNNFTNKLHVIDKYIKKLDGAYCRKPIVLEKSCTPLMQKIKLLLTKIKVFVPELLDEQPQIQKLKDKFNYKIETFSNEKGFHCISIKKDINKLFDNMMIKKIVKNNMVQQQSF